MRVVQQPPQVQRPLVPLGLPAVSDSDAGVRGQHLAVELREMVREQLWEEANMNE